MLSYEMFVYDLYGMGAYVNPIGLDWNTTAEPFENQHARVDILTDTAGPFDTDVTSVVLNLYLDVDGDGTAVVPYQSYVFDVTADLVAAPPISCASPRSTTCSSCTWASTTSASTW
jgi:hypothetical protein